MEQIILNKDGKDTGQKVILNDSVFSVTPNNHLIYLDVKQFMANNRQGTAKAKQRSENAHSTRKLGRQKGGGGARPGDFKSPVRIGGGTIFGPVPRDYNFKLNKKVKRNARRSALSTRMLNGQIIILDELSFDKPSTKSMVKILDDLNLTNNKVLIVLPNPNINVLKSARNLKKVNVISAEDLNTFSIMNANTIVLLKDAIESIESMCNA